MKTYHIDLTNGVNMSLINSLFYLPPSYKPFTRDPIVKKDFLWLSVTAPLGLLFLSANRVSHYLKAPLPQTPFSRSALLTCQIASCYSVCYYAADLFRQVQAHHLFLAEQSSCQNRNIALVLQAAGADDVFSNQEEIVYIFRKVMDAGYTPLFRKVATLTEFSHEIDKLITNENRIKILWIRAHGASSAIVISENELINSKTLPTIRKSIQQIESDAVVVLDSCKTGNHRWAPKEGPIASQIAQQLPGRSIYSATELSYGDSITVTNLKPFEVKFVSRIYDQGVFSLDHTRKYKFDHI